MTQADRPDQRVPSGPSNIHVAMAASEVVPFAKSGGLGDVLGSLPQALERLGVRVTVVMPGYRTVTQGGFPVEDTGVRLPIPLSGRLETGAVWKTRMGKDITVYLIGSDRYFDRTYLYGTPGGDYADNAERFVFFSRAVLEVLRLDPPNILHAHDWQAALSVAFLKAQPDLYPELASVKTVLTVHNLGYQGIFWYLDWHLLGLDWRFFTPRYLEFHQRINFLKGGLVFADAVTTVSPSYAQEVQTPEQGFGLDGVFRERRADLVGILNGVDYDVWDPSRDPYLAATYGPPDLAGKWACKADLQRTFGLPEELDIPLVGMVTRLAMQKGFDLLEDALDEVMRRNLQVALLGTGDRRYEEMFREIAVRYPGKAAARIAFDESLAHKITAGSDILLMPSRYEPGGLTQIYALRYGTVPLVRATGGLRDTVEEFDPAAGRGTGFRFDPYTTVALLDALDRALAVFPNREAWTTLMRNGMAADYSWDRSTQAYLDLYRSLLAS